LNLLFSETLRCVPLHLVTDVSGQRVGRRRHPNPWKWDRHLVLKHW